MQCRHRCVQECPGRQSKRRRSSKSPSGPRRRQAMSHWGAFGPPFFDRFRRRADNSRSRPRTAQLGGKRPYRGRLRKTGVRAKAAVPSAARNSPTALRYVPAPGRNGRDPIRDARTGRRPERPVILSGSQAGAPPGVSGRCKSPRWRSAWRRQDPASLGCG
jgi:hypothetical protein